MVTKEKNRNFAADGTIGLRRYKMQVHNMIMHSMHGGSFFSLCIFALTRIQFEAEDERLLAHTCTVYTLVFLVYEHCFPMRLQLKKKATGVVYR